MLIAHHVPLDDGGRLVHVEDDGGVIHNLDLIQEAPDRALGEAATHEGHPNVLGREGVAVAPLHAFAKVDGERRFVGVYVPIGGHQGHPGIIGPLVNGHGGMEQGTVDSDAQDGVGGEHVQVADGRHGIGIRTGEDARPGGSRGDLDRNLNGFDDLNCLLNFYLLGDDDGFPDDLGG